MTDFTATVTAPCVCTLCGAELPAPTIVVSGGRLTWEMPRCERCLTVAYDDGVRDSEHNLTVVRQRTRT